MELIAPHSRESRGRDRFLSDTWRSEVVSQHMKIPDWLNEALSNYQLRTEPHG
jgi:hypothetical protein